MRKVNLREVKRLASQHTDSGSSGVGSQAHEDHREPVYHGQCFPQINYYIFHIISKNKTRSTQTDSTVSPWISIKKTTICIIPLIVACLCVCHSSEQSQRKVISYSQV